MPLALSPSSMKGSGLLVALGLLFTSGPVAAAALGEQKVVVVLTNFRNTPMPSLTAAQVNSVFTQLNSFYQEASYNKMSLSWEIHEYPLDMDQTCSYPTVQRQAITEGTTNQGINFNQFQHLVVVAPYGTQATCGWAGVGGPTGSFDTCANGTIPCVGTLNISRSAILSTSGNAYVMGHEFGHQLGNDHALMYECPGVPFQSSGCTITSNVYKDFFSIMGGGQGWWQPHHFNAIQKEDMGWLSTANVETVASDGTYELFPIETSADNLKVLKVPRGSGEFFYVEYRQPIGTDIGMDNLPFDGHTDPTNVYNGALIHFRISGQLRTLLVDTSVSGSDPASYMSAALEAGQSFVDPGTGTTILVVSKNAASLTVHVDVFSETPAPTPTPTATPPPPPPEDETPVSQDPLDSTSPDPAMQSQLEGSDSNLGSEVVDAATVSSVGGCRSKQAAELWLPMLLSILGLCFRSVRTERVCGEGCSD